MSSPRTFIAMLVLACCALATASAQEPDAPAERHVRRIDWIGIEAVSEKELEDAILTAEADWRPWVERRPYEPGTLEQDLARLRRFYQRRGYYQAEVRAEVGEPDEDSVIVTIFVTEGEPVVLAELRLTLPGSAERALPTADELRRDLPLEIGGTFSADRYEQSKQLLLQRLAGLGHPAATTTGGAEVDLQARVARVEWTLEPGPFVRFGETTPVGLERVAPDLVLGEVGWKPGDPYDPRVLQKTQREIFALGLFRSVSIRPVPPQHAADGERAAEERWPLEIQVLERAPRALRAGVGFSTDERLRLKLEWRHRNFLGGLRGLRVGARYSFLERGVEAVFSQPRFLDRDNLLSLDAVFSEETEPGFDASGASAGWLIERPIRGWQARVGQRFELKRVTDVQANDAVVLSGEDESFRLVFFDLGVRRSSLDVPLDPRKGSWFDFSLEPSFSALGSEVSYLKAIAEARYFWPLGERLVLASRARLGTLEPLAGDDPDNIPIFKRFFSGGGASVRGFELDRLGPLDSQEDPLGGLTLSEASVELRFPIWRELGGVTFVDGGQVALDSFRLYLNDFFYSTGAGLRYKTPIGPLRLDVAQILNPPDGINDFRVHFSVGHAF